MPAGFKYGRRPPEESCPVVAISALLRASPLTSNSHTFGSFRHFGNFGNGEMPKLKEIQTDMLTL
jgi:hypothetical protein